MWLQGLCSLSLILALTLMCMGQTFQYSRGWTNGKRASKVVPLHFQREEDIGFPDIFDTQQDSERKLEKCLMQIDRYMRNPLLVRAPSRPSVMPMISTPSSTNHNNNIFGNHHQSNELFEDANSVEPGDYGKH